MGFESREARFKRGRERFLRSSYAEQAVWKEIPGFQGRYLINRVGVVLSLVGRNAPKPLRHWRGQVRPYDEHGVAKQFDVAAMIRKVFGDE